MRTFVYTLSTFPGLLGLAGQPLDAAVHLQGSPVSRPWPGLRPGCDAAIVTTPFNLLMLQELS